MRNVALPIGFVQRILKQLRLVGFGGGVPALGKLIDLQVVVCREAFHLRHDDDVCQLARLCLVGLDPHRKSTLEHAQNGVEVALAHRLEGQTDRNHDVGFHVVNLHRRQILQDGAVDVLVAVQLKGAKDAGDGGRGPNRVRQRAAGEGDRLCRGKICRLAAERDR